MFVDFRGVTAIYGRPGVGKTSLAMRIAYERVKKGGRVLWVSLYEDKETFLKNAKSLGYDLSNVEFWDLIFVKPEIILNQIVSTVSQEEFSLVVADSLTALLETVQSREYLINAIYRVFKPAGIDFVGTAEEESASPFDYVADNVVKLELRFRKGVAERRLYVMKARGRRAGYYTEFDIVEGRGVEFLEDLPRPAPRGSWQVELPFFPEVASVRGGCIYFITGAKRGYVLSRIAAELSKHGLKVLYRVLGRDVHTVLRTVERYGGKVKVMRVDPRPISYFAHIRNFYESLVESDADVVIADGVDVEFVTYGKKAFEINRYELEELRRLGVANFIGAERAWGIRHLSDVWIDLKLDKVYIHSPGGVFVCDYPEDPELVVSSCRRL